MATRADHERRVREAAAVDSDFKLSQVRTLSQDFDLDNPPSDRVEQPTSGAPRKLTVTRAMQ